MECIENNTIKQKLVFLNNFTKLLYSSIEEEFNLMPEKEFSLFAKYLETEKLIWNIFSLFISEIDLLKEKILSLNNENLLLNEKNTSIAIDLKELRFAKEEKTNLELENMLQEYQTSVLLENHKLSKELNILKERMADSTNLEEIAFLKKKIENFENEKNNEFKELKQKLIHSDQTYSNIKTKYSSLKTANRKMEKELNSLIARYDIMQNEYKYYYEKKNMFEQLSNQYREIALMTKEELDGKDSTIKDITFSFNKLKDKLYSLQKKLDKFVESETKKFNEPTNEEHDVNVGLLSGFETSLSQDKTFKKNIYKEYQETNPIQITKNTSLFSLTLEETALFSLRLFKPSFFNLIPHVKNDSALKDNPITFLATIRSIFDSKFNEFDICNYHKQWSKFPEFVYSWLGRFSFSLSERKIQSIEVGVDPGEKRANFARELMSFRYNKLWDVTAFKEFLTEERELDELYFYLYCRFLLFKGPQLETLGGTFDSIHYVSFDEAAKLVHNIMKLYENLHVGFVLGKLKERTKKKNKNFHCIDSAFVLKMLLEFYHIEKKNRIQLIRDLFYSQPPSSNAIEFSLNFDSFKKLMDYNFPRISECEKFELFRNCWNVGKGIVNHENFCAVASENNIFIKHLKLTLTLNLPIQLDNDRNLVPEHPSYKSNVILIDEYKNYEKIIEFILEKIESLGVESVADEYKYYFELIREKFQLNTQFVWEKTFYFIFSRMIGNSKKILDEFFVQKSLTKDFDESKIVELDTKIFKLIVEFYQDIRKRELLEKIEKNFRVKKVQKIVKQRVIKFYKNINTALSKKKK